MLDYRSVLYFVELVRNFPHTFDLNKPKTSPRGRVQRTGHRWTWMILDASSSWSMAVRTEWSIETWHMQRCNENKRLALKLSMLLKIIQKKKRASNNITHSHETNRCHPQRKLDIHKLPIPNQHSSNHHSQKLIKLFMAGQPTPPNVPPPRNNKALLRAY